MKFLRWPDVKNRDGSTPHHGKELVAINRLQSPPSLKEATGDIAALRDEQEFLN
jgi:hypothetical protein